MLTRLKVSGFKNLVDVDVRFGAFTCIAGGNGVGKSNLFDAIRFLSALAQMPLTEAALSIRDGSGKASDIRNLFHRVGDNYVNKMSFEVEMIIPSEGIDNVGQKVEAVNKYLKYSLDLAYKKINLSYDLEITKEKLIPHRRDDLDAKMLLKNKPNDLIKFKNDEKYNQFINTEIDENRDIKLLSIFSYKSGQKSFPAIGVDSKTTNQTALNLFTGVSMLGGYDTQFLARQEMMSWQLLQLEPSALGKADEFTAPNKLSIKGNYLASSFYYLVEKYYQQENNKLTAKEIALKDTATHKSKIYTQASNRLAELIDDVDEVWVDRDDKRELLTLMVKDKQGTVYPARSLSDGTLRFLALTVLEIDPDSPRLLCLEEPENGIYPDRIPKILELLQDIAVDLDEPIDFNNPLRQVIINTHSPVVVQQVPEDSLLIADLEENIVDGQRFKQATFRYLAGTWRDVDSGKDKNNKAISKGELLSYLNPVSRHFKDNRVIDRKDIQSLIPGN